MRTIALITALALPAVALAQSAGFSPAKVTAADRQMVAEGAKLSLADPASARIEGLAAFAKQSDRIVCGQVNAKNAFGGYAGFQTFKVLRLTHRDTGTRAVMLVGPQAVMDCHAVGYRY